MSQSVGEAVTPFGAPEVAPEPVDFEVGRPRLGGLQTPVAFSPEHTGILNVLADTLISPGEGFPAPSQVGIVNFIGRYVNPSGYRVKHYPFAAEDDFKAALDRLGSRFVEAEAADRAETLARLQTQEDPFFEQIRSLVYYGYYSRPEVTLAIRNNLAAGRDYHGPPQPYGYIDCIEWWDADLLAACGGGGYLATDKVQRVDLSKLTWKQPST